MISKVVSIIATITILAIAAVLLTYNNNVGMAQQVPFSPQPQTPQPQTPYPHGYFYPGWIKNWLGPRLGYYLPPPQLPHNNVIISPPPTAAYSPYSRQRQSTTTVTTINTTNNSTSASTSSVNPAFLFSLLQIPAVP